MYFLGTPTSPLVGRLGILVRHLEEDEVGELLEVVAVAHAVVAEGVAEAPNFGDDGFGGHGGKFGRLCGPRGEIGWPNSGSSKPNSG